MEYPKTWLDQPDEVLAARPLCAVRGGEKGETLEVRHHPDGHYYVTAGTLFGSRTVRCPDSGIVFDAIAFNYGHGAYPSLAILCRNKEES